MLVFSPLFTDFEQVGCGDDFGGDIGNDQSRTFQFTNYQTQDISIVPRHSNFNGRIQLTNIKGSAVALYSMNDTISVDSLPPGQYQIAVSSHSDSDGTFQLHLICEPDVDCSAYEHVASNVTDDAVFQYQCDYKTDIESSLAKRLCISDRFDVATIVHVVMVFETIESLGLGFELPSALCVLLSFHIITLCFFFYALKSMALPADHDAVPRIVALLHLILISVFLYFKTSNYAQCDFTLFGYTLTEDAPSPYHAVPLSLCFIFCSLWYHLSSRGGSGWCPKGCKYPLFVWTIIVPLFLILFLGWWYGQFYVFANIYLCCHLLVPLMLLDSVSPFRIRSKYFWIASFMLCFNVMFGANPFLYNWFGFCSMYSLIFYFNPLFVYASCGLLCTKFKFLVLFQCLMFSGIFAFDFATESAVLCIDVVNISFMVHAICVPFYMVLLFCAFPKLRKLASSVFACYLVLFDIYSDFVVIYYFTKSDPIFACLQMAFIIFGQFAGAISEFGNGDALTTADRVMSLFGFGNLFGMSDDLPFTNLGTLFVVDDLDCGAAHCCAMSFDGVLKCWGLNHVCFSLCIFLIQYLLIDVCLDALYVQVGQLDQ